MTNIQLEHALSGDRQEITDSNVGLISFYTAVPDVIKNETPLLLIHTVNAAAGAHEIKPLYEHYRQYRPVYALDLPGYGFSDRTDRPYTARLMTDALHAITAEIKNRHGNAAIDAVAVSLPCEFLARAAVEHPSDFKSLGLISPTGFNRMDPPAAEEGSNRGMAWFHNFLTTPVIGKALFKGLVSRGSVRFFLQKTWGSKQIDEEMYQYAYQTAQQPGARHAPFYFLSGYLFSKDATKLYEALNIPVFMSHGVRGDFTNYCWKEKLEDRKNWQFKVYETGALSYFEKPEQFIEDYDAFLETN